MAKNKNNPSLVVGVGASAGGVIQLQEFFNAVSPETQASFLVVQHLPKETKSFMPDLIRSRTNLTVQTGEDQMKIEPANVYLIPPGTHLRVKDGKLSVTETEDPKTLVYHPVDNLFLSLAENYKKNAVVVVLSGSGSDGAKGVKAVGKAGGLVIVESQQSAPFTGMPGAAMNTGEVDLITTPTGAAKALYDYERTGRRPESQRRFEDTVFEEELPDSYAGVIGLLRQRYNVNFSVYKVATVTRRIQRRMELVAVESPEEYFQLLQDNEDELNHLLNDLLIGVTKFFRDPKAFEILRSEVIPHIFEGTAVNEEIRVWAPGCATGEEAYSLAMLLQEYKDKNNLSRTYRVFGSDLLKTVLTRANNGVYADSQIENVPEEIRNKYLEKVDQHTYKVIPKIKENTLFAPHNLIENPPFTKMHLVSCRNLLIYLSTEVQRKALSLLNFALRPEGFLFLGPSETLSIAQDDFDTIEREWKLFRKKPGAPKKMHLDLTRPNLQPPSQYSTESNQNRMHSMLQRFESDDRQSLINVYDILLDKYLPSSLLFNEDQKLLHVIGDAGKHLRVSGRLTGELSRILSDELRTAIGSAILSSGKDGKAIYLRSIPVKRDEMRYEVDVQVNPIAVGTRQYFMVQVIEHSESKKKQAPPSARKDYDAAEYQQRHISSLREELNLTKQSLQATIEELETTNEELQASNEELMSSNEELQSTNEELHALNEELQTVNAEYQGKIEELTRLNQDIESLYNSTEIATIFLDSHSCIRKYSPAATGIFNILKRDIGRRLTDIKTVLLDDDLESKLQPRFLEAPEEYEVRSRYEDVYLMRISSPQSVIDKPEEAGLIVSFIDITKIKELEKQFQKAVEAAPSAMLLINEDYEIHMTTLGARDIFGLKEKPVNIRLLDLFEEKSQDLLKASLKSVFTEQSAAKKQEALSLMALTSDGSEVPVEVLVTPVPSLDSKLAFLSVTNLHERKKELEEKLKEVPLKH